MNAARRLAGLAFLAVLTAGATPEAAPGSGAGRGVLRLEEFRVPDPDDEALFPFRGKRRSREAAGPSGALLLGTGLLTGIGFILALLLPRFAAREDR